MPFKASKAQGKDWLMREPDEVEECEADVWKAKYMLKDEEVKELKQENLQLRWERDNALASLAADSSIVSSTSLVSSIASEATSSEDPSEEPSIEMDTVPSHTNSHMRELERKIDDLTLGNHDARLDNEILIRKVAALTKEKCKLEQDLTHERESRLASEKTHEKSLNVLTESKQSEVALERNVISWREKHDRLAEKMSNSMARIAFLEDQLRILTKEKVELEQSSARVQLQYAAEVADLKEKIGLTVTHLETARDRATTLRMTVQEQNDPSLTRDTEGIYSPPAVTYASQSPGSEHLEQAPPAIMAEQKTPGQHATHAGHERLPSVVASSQHNIQKFDALVSTLVAKSEPGDRVLIASLHREPKALAHAIKAMYRAHQDPSNEALLNTSPTVETPALRRSYISQSARKSALPVSSARLSYSVSGVAKRSRASTLVSPTKVSSSSLQTPRTLEDRRISRLDLFGGQRPFTTGPAENRTPLTATRAVMNAQQPFGKQPGREVVDKRVSIGFLPKK